MTETQGVFCDGASGPKGSLKGVSTVEIGREEWYLMSIEGGIMEESEISENSTECPPMSCSCSNLSNVKSLEQIQEFSTGLGK